MQQERQADHHAGLCASCRHAHVQKSARGNEFWRCGRAEEDAAWLRYPPLPVAQCAGHQGGEPQVRGSR